MSKPLMIDLFAGLGGWAEGGGLEGYHGSGFDIEQHVYGEHRYPAQLVVQDVLTLHGSQFKDAALIVASPPCQEYSYMAMPWKLAKAKAAAIRADTTGESLVALNRLFNACFCIQAQASLAAGRYIPMVVENVRGAQPWVGRSRWAWGSFHLWGDVPALMPIAIRAAKVPGLDWNGFKNGDPNYRGQAFNPAAQGRAMQEARAIKNGGGSWFKIAHNTTSGKGQNPDGRKTSGAPHRREGQPHTKHLTNPGEHYPDENGRKVSGDWFGSYADMKAAGSISPGRLHGKGSIKRKAASAMIAKIPLPLSRHIAAIYRPAPSSR